jgi:hypothetical protein
VGADGDQPVPDRVSARGKHWISITRSNGHFYAVQPIENSERKMQEYLLYEGTCVTTQ